MEITIGIQNVVREITVETDDSADTVIKAVEAALASGSTLTLKDSRGRTVLVPAPAIGWIQVGDPEKGRVGFGQLNPKP